MGDDGQRVFLKIIGRQPVVFGADECFEEAPRAARNHPRKLNVGGH